MKVSKIVREAVREVSLLYHFVMLNACEASPIDESSKQEILR